MFCKICGQPIAKSTEFHPDYGTVTYYYHTTAKTYPQLNDHVAKPGA